MKNTIYKIIGIVLLTVQMAHAQSGRMFLKGAEILAETVTAGYSGNAGDYIEIWNVNYSTINNRLITTVPFLNNPNTRAASGVLSFTKYKSKNSKIFHEKIVKGIHFATLEIAFAKAIPNSNPLYQTYLNYKMTDIFVVSIKDSGEFTETIELVMKKIYMDYKPTNPQSGQLGTSITYGWNFATGVFWNGI